MAPSLRSPRIVGLLTATLSLLLLVLLAFSSAGAAPPGAPTGVAPATSGIAKDEVSLPQGSEEELAGLGIAWRSAGDELLADVDTAQKASLQAAGIAFTVRRSFIELVAPAATGSVVGQNNTPQPFGYYDWSNSGINIANAPSSAVVTSIDIDAIITGDQGGVELKYCPVYANGFICADLAGGLGAVHQTHLTEYVGQPANGWWYLLAHYGYQADYSLSGAIQSWTIRIYYDTAPYSYSSVSGHTNTWVSLVDWNWMWSDAWVSGAPANARVAYIDIDADISASGDTYGLRYCPAGFLVYDCISLYNNVGSSTHHQYRHLTDWANWPVNTVWYIGGKVFPPTSASIGPWTIRIYYVVGNTPPQPTATPTPVGWHQVDIPVSYDTYTSQGNQAGNFRLSPELNAGYMRQLRAWLKFDLSAIPADANLTSARLYLWHLRSGDVSLDVFHPTSDWPETAFSWSGQPGYDPTPAANRWVGIEQPMWATWELRNLATEWLAGHKPNNGIMITDHDDTNTAVFASKEASDSGHRPFLRLAYFEAEEAPMVTATPTASATATPSVTPTEVRTPPPPTVTFTPTHTATASPTRTWSPTVSPTICPQATPEPLWVEPVTSPTNSLAQIITVRIGNGEAVTITTESGVFAVQGSFDAYSHPAQVVVDLLPNTTHHLLVQARVRQTWVNGCPYGGYVLSASADRYGGPLVIVQQGGGSTPTRTPTSLPGMERRIWLPIILSVRQ